MFRDPQSYRTLTENEKGKRTKQPAVYKKVIVSDKMYKCDICNEDWMSEIDVELHRRHKHSRSLMEAGNYKNSNMCLICFRKQSSHEELLQHIKTIHFYSSPNAKKIEREVFFCDICDQMFFTKDILAWHIFYVHSTPEDSNVEFDCVICMKRSRGRNMWQHSLTHRFSSFTTCPFCFVNFKDLTDLRDHISKHNYLLRCDICLFETKTRESYEKHLEEHSSRSNNNIMNCEKYFISTIEPRYPVETWMKGIQIPRGIHICVLCRHICTDQKSRKDHICIDHGNVNMMKKIYMCACGENFFNGLLLKHHVWKMKGIHRALKDDEIKEKETENSILLENNQDIEEDKIDDKDPKNLILFEINKDIGHDEQTHSLTDEEELSDIHFNEDNQNSPVFDVRDIVLDEEAVDDEKHKDLTDDEQQDEELDEEIIQEENESECLFDIQHLENNEGEDEIVYVITMDSSS